MRLVYCYPKIILRLFGGFLFLFRVESRAQFVSEPSHNYGFNLGLNLAFGSHFQRLGLNLNFYYYQDYVQLNSEIRLYRNFRNLGPHLSYDELVLSQGVTFGYGNKTDSYNPFIQSVSNQTGYTRSFAYAYNAYFNKIKTKQQTGTLAFQFGDIYFITENDILARPQLDRYRTGAFLILYQYQNQYQYAVNCTMWTGQFGNRVNLNDSSTFARCYMDTTGGNYTGFSHGLLSLQFKSILKYSQNVQVNAGKDAEEVRNFVQNKIIHNASFLPKKWRPTKNCYMPMVDKNGEPYLFRKGQEIKDASWYLNAFTNANLFY